MIKTVHHGQILSFVAIALSTAILIGCATIPAHAQDVARASTLPDLSGLAWVEDDLFIESYVTWPAPIQNVEATEVCQVGRQLVFLYAERAEGLPATKLRWATLSLKPHSSRMHLTSGSRRA